MRKWVCFIAAFAIMIGIAPPTYGAWLQKKTGEEVEPAAKPSIGFQPVIDVASRRAELETVPRSELRQWCRGSTTPASLGRKATIRGPSIRQESNVQHAGNALFDNIAAYYGGNSRAAESIRDALAQGAEIGAFTELAPYDPPEFSGYNPMNEPVFQVASFMVPLAHAFLILKKEYPHERDLLSDVKQWGDHLYKVTRDAGATYGGKAKGIDRRAYVAAGWALWANATNDRDVLARAKRYYRLALYSFGRRGVDRIWRHKGKHRIRYVNSTVAAALVAAYALKRSGETGVYDLAPKRGTLVEGAVWVWRELVEGRHPDLLRARSPGGRSVAWIELFIREFPEHPTASEMRSWISRSGMPLYGYLAGGPTSCFYRRISRNP